MKHIGRVGLTILGTLTLCGATTIGIRRALHLPTLPAFLRPAHPLPTGQCTWYAFGRAAEAGWNIRFDVNSGRHARLWWKKVTNAQKSQTPTPGAVLVLDAWPGNEYGHVAYVESVENGNSFTITHANFSVGNPVGTREGVVIYRASAHVTSDGISLEGRPPLPLVGFLEKT
ncbi:MAG: CHAP domain-containing protein [Armatimonas sp.]